MEPADNQEQEPAQDPKLSSRSPMFAVEPPLNLATASRDEIIAWFRQFIEPGSEVTGWSKAGFDVQ